MSCEEPMETTTVAERFTDPKDVVPPETLQDLIEQLTEVFESDRVNIDYVKELMASYRSKPSEWKKFAYFDPHRYTRNLVDEGNGKFNLILVCWSESQGSAIHSHANAHCFMKVMQGTLKEELYDWPEEENGSGQQQQQQQQQQPMKVSEVHTHTRDQVTYISDDIGLHRVENPSHSERAVSLHLYSPPFLQCDSFDQRTGHAKKVTMTFWSKKGKRTPFGKKGSIESCMATAEDN